MLVPSGFTFSFPLKRKQAHSDILGEKKWKKITISSLSVQRWSQQIHFCCTASSFTSSAANNNKHWFFPLLGLLGSGGWAGLAWAWVPAELVFVCSPTRVCSSSSDQHLLGGFFPRWKVTWRQEGEQKNMMPLEVFTCHECSGTTTPIPLDKVMWLSRHGWGSEWHLARSAPERCISQQARVTICHNHGYLTGAFPAYGIFMHAVHGWITVYK